MLSSLASLPRASATLPFLRMFYGQISEYIWYDDTGQAHIGQQAEGGEQGDPMMPALFSPGQHPAFEEVATYLRNGEHLFAYLNDIYLICSPDRAKHLFDLVSNLLLQRCGIQVNLGKTRVWNAGGFEPPGFEDIVGDDAQASCVGSSCRPS